jgi:glutathione synthase/RimK-type ligase-like ATP-grasp enzyme
VNRPPPRVALVTGDVDRAAAEHLDAPLAAALAERGAEVVTPSWRDAGVSWSSFDVAVVRTTWDYPSDREAFVAWAAATGEATRLVNPPDVLRWNTHKSYLLELEDRGAPVVPTAWLGAGDEVDLAALLRSRGWSRAVIKPAVGVGSQGVLPVADDGRRGVADDGPRAAADGAGQRHLDTLLAAGDVLVQPYLDGVADGELSVVVVDGEPSHAVRKLPAAGEFRVQPQYGGTSRPEVLDRDIAALARWVVDAVGTPLLLARVDLITDPSGTPQLSELEATEPDLLLHAAPQAAGRIADAVLSGAGT